MTGRVIATSSHILLRWAFLAETNKTEEGEESKDSSDANKGSRDRDTCGGAGGQTTATIVDRGGRCGRRRGAICGSSCLGGLLAAGSLRRAVCLARRVSCTEVVRLVRSRRVDDAGVVAADVLVVCRELSVVDEANVRTLVVECRLVIKLIDDEKGGVVAWAETEGGKVRCSLTEVTGTKFVHAVAIGAERVEAGGLADIGVEDLGVGDVGSLDKSEITVACGSIIARQPSDKHVGGLTHGVLGARPACETATRSISGSVAAETTAWRESPSNGSCFVCL